MCVRLCGIKKKSYVFRCHFFLLWIPTMTLSLFYDIFSSLRMLKLCDWGGREVWDCAGDSLECWIECVPKIFTGRSLDFEPFDVSRRTREKLSGFGWEGKRNGMRDWERKLSGVWNLGLQEQKNVCSINKSKSLSLISLLQQQRKIQKNRIQSSSLHNSSIFFFSRRSGAKERVFNQQV